MMPRKTPSLTKYSVSDRDFLNKKPKTSTKYSKIASKTNSGFNAHKRQEVEKEIVKYYKVCNDEPFRRISLGNLLCLMAAYVEECSLCTMTVENFSEPKDNQTENWKRNIEQKFYWPERDTSNQEVETQNANDEELLQSPFLLVDVRSEAEFLEGHIASAISYPHSRLSRAVNWESRHLIEYKNHPQWIIVLYDENEMLSPDVAAVLIHRGYVNVFVLSGGLRLASDKVGAPLITKDRRKSISPSLADFLTERSFSRMIPTGVRSSSWWEDSANCGDLDATSATEYRRIK